jgi:hypothetical protein
MGHADYTNLGKFFLSRLYAKGKLSLAEVIEAAMKVGESVHASEGPHADESTLGMAFEEIVYDLARLGDPVVTKRGIFRAAPIIEPVTPLTAAQVKALSDWYSDEGIDDCYEDLDSVRWKFGEGWRKKYPQIRTLGNVTH